MINRRYPTLTGAPLRKYFLEYATPSKEFGEGFYVVHKPLPAFKKAYNRHTGFWDRHSRIVNLVIPVGAIVYVKDITRSTDKRKMRADKAYVHSIADMHSKQPRKVAHAGWAHDFVYRVGEHVIPHQPFCTVPSTCESGIHFFLNLQDALSY